MFDVRWRIAAGVQTPPGVQRYGLSAVEATTVADAMTQARILLGPRFGIAGTERQIEITACVETPATAAANVRTNTAMRATANALLKQYPNKK